MTYAYLLTHLHSITYAVSFLMGLSPIDRACVWLVRQCVVAPCIVRQHMPWMRGART